MPETRRPKMGHVQIINRFPRREENIITNIINIIQRASARYASGIKSAKDQLSAETGEELALSVRDGCRAPEFSV